MQNNTFLSVADCFKMSNDESNEWAIYENNKRAETDYLCKIFEKKLLNPRKKGRLKQCRKIKRKRKSMKNKGNQLLGQKLTGDEEKFVNKYTVECYIPIRNSDFANLIMTVELDTTGDENLDPMTKKSLDKAVKTLEAERLYQSSDKPGLVVIIGKTAPVKRRRRKARFSSRKKRNASQKVDQLNNAFGLPVDRSIRHRWVDNDGVTRDYLGRIILVDAEDTCSITYQGSVDIYQLTVRELYMDYLNGDLDFE